ncbi:MAG TPA: TlpA disulfide reductase family protein [Candidatus Omnitrophota bacterium]|nr:TlpA disulfide reductase family protein [Candidatus Omnitrophota bacterium]HPT39050.1 TlpA disulfide reductase family protein [Candidatus Omnitrophota bacterium]
MINFIKFKLPVLIITIFLVLGFGKAAPAADMILNDLAGKPVNLSNYKGKPVILFFWTTWCPYCRQELNKLNLQQAKISREGILILGVNVNEPKYKVQRFFKGYTLNFQMLLDSSGALADKYNLIGVPTFVFLDKTGKEISQTHNLPANYKDLLFR